MHGSAALQGGGGSIRLVAMPPTTEQPSSYQEREDTEQEICLMSVEDKSTMKAACLQAAATLIAARDSGKGQIDVEECITLAALIYVRVVASDWREPA